MADSHHKADPLPSSNKTEDQASYDALFKTLDTQLTSLEQETHKIMACYRFLNDVTRNVMAHSETPLPEATDSFHFGMYVIHDWLEDLGAKATVDIRDIKIWVTQQSTILRAENPNDVGSKAASTKKKSVID